MLSQCDVLNLLDLQLQATIANKWIARQDGQLNLGNAITPGCLMSSSLIVEDLECCWETCSARSRRQSSVCATALVCDARSCSPNATNSTTCTTSLQRLRCQRTLAAILPDLGDLKRLTRSTQAAFRADEGAMMICTTQNSDSTRGREVSSTFLILQNTDGKPCQFSGHQGGSRP